MGVEENGLTLEGLAERLEALERENAGLRDEVVALRGSDTALTVGPEPGGRVSRRALLSKAGAAAVAAVAAGTLLGPRQAQAHDLGGPITGDNVTTHRVNAQNHTSFDAPALTGLNTSGQWPAVFGRNEGTESGVYGAGIGGPGVEGTSSNWGQAGVYGHHFGPGSGVLGEGNGSTYAGVLGRNETGIAVRGESGANGYGSVYGQHTGTSGFGVVGDGKGSTGAGVLGRNSATGGYGLQGEGFTGVRGKGTGGYGGFFEGGKAQMRILPKSTSGRPTSGNHAKGEVYMDSVAALWVCTVGGTPGTWRKVTTTAS